MKNLKRSDDAIIFYVQNNKKLNSFFNKKKGELILNKNSNFNRNTDLLLYLASRSENMNLLKMT